MRYLRQNTAVVISVGPFIDHADGLTPLDALTETDVDGVISYDDDDGSVGAHFSFTCSASLGDNDLVAVGHGGRWLLELTQAQTNYTGRMTLDLYDPAQTCPVFHEFTVLAANVYDSLFTGAGPTADLLDVNTTQVSGTVQTAGDVIASISGIGSAGGAGINQDCAKDNYAGGTMSAADGVLVSGVLTPTVSPGWTISELVGKTIRLGPTDWYAISANSATAATITAPPADLQRQWFGAHHHSCRSGAGCRVSVPDGRGNFPGRGNVDGNSQPNQRHHHGSGVETYGYCRMGNHRDYRGADFHHRMGAEEVHALCPTLRHGGGRTRQDISAIPFERGLQPRSAD
jgi:hypothetical protein